MATFKNHLAVLGLEKTWHVMFFYSWRGSWRRLPTSTKVLNKLRILNPDREHCASVEIRSTYFTSLPVIVWLATLFQSGSVMYAQDARLATLEQAPLQANPALLCDTCWRVNVYHRSQWVAPPASYGHIGASVEGPAYVTEDKGKSLHAGLDVVDEQIGDRTLHSTRVGLACALKLRDPSDQRFYVAVGLQAEWHQLDLNEDLVFRDQIDPRSGQLGTTGEVLLSDVTSTGNVGFGVHFSFGRDLQLGGSLAHAFKKEFSLLNGTGQLVPRYTVHGRAMIKGHCEPMVLFQWQDGHQFRDIAIGLPLGYATTAPLKLEGHYRWMSQPSGGNNLEGVSAGISARVKLDNALVKNIEFGLIREWNLTELGPSGGQAWALHVAFYAGCNEELCKGVTPDGRSGSTVGKRIKKWFSGLFQNVLRMKF